jgi:hypothetical protein
MNGPKLHVVGSEDEAPKPVIDHGLVSPDYEKWLPITSSLRAATGIGWYRDQVSCREHQENPDLSPLMVKCGPLTEQESQRVLAVLNKLNELIARDHPERALLPIHTEFFTGRNSISLPFETMKTLCGVEGLSKRGLDFAAMLQAEERAERAVTHPRSEKFRGHVEKIISGFKGGDDTPRR